MRIYFQIKRIIYFNIPSQNTFFKFYVCLCVCIWDYYFFVYYYFFIIIFYFFPDRVSLCRLRACPDTRSADQVGLKLTEICLSSAGIKFMLYHHLALRLFLDKEKILVHLIFSQNILWALLKRILYKKHNQTCIHITFVLNQRCMIMELYFCFDAPFHGRIWWERLCERIAHILFIKYLFPCNYIDLLMIVLLMTKYVLY